MDAEVIPAELRHRPQWVVWRRTDRDGRTTKVPYRADRAGRASSTDPATWATFGAAVAALEHPGISGLGFVFTNDDLHCGIDLDGGLPAPDRTAIVAALASYTETSVSGSGLHVIIAAKLNGSRNRRGPFEVYDEARFFVMTGLHVPGTPTTIKERQSELDEVLAEYLPARPPAPRPGVARIPVNLDDAELLGRAFVARNGRELRALFEGSWEGRYPSQSEADLALVGGLAFWTGGDCDRIDRLFRSSGLMRDKWDSRRGSGTYGARTIELALRGAGVGVA